TFREAGSATLELDLSRFVDSIGEDIQLLVRPHYLNAMDIPRSMRSDVVDVSAVGDANRVLMASDVLVTDYSSIMFDYLVLDRPIILYAYDYADYTQSARGTYFDLHTHAPGPLAMTQEKLTSELRKLVDGQDNRTEVRSAFRDRFAGREPGNSAETTVETVWSVSGSLRSASSGLFCWPMKSIDSVGWGDSPTKWQSDSTNVGTPPKS